MPESPEIQAPRPLLLIQCEIFAEASPLICARTGEMDGIFRGALALGEDRLKVVRVCSGEALPDPREIAGAIVTGAAAMVGDPLPWIAQTAEWLRQAHASGVPLLGICFGHQLLTHALGGTVAPNAIGPEYGTVEIRSTEAADDDPLLGPAGPAGKTFKAQSAHFQTATVAPEGATVLAEGASGIQALRFGPSTWGVQFHPEFDPEMVGLIIEEIHGPLADAGADVEAARASLQRTPEAAAVLTRFRDLALAENRAAAPSRAAAG
ncbi:GMP synthase (glutamine-hydrolysing) [Faunimonas pinastri]|uniref:GMP synthase (Glutamine-hydrolysing) n=1 Tax=Faunimonas pinastri TaxID=1855383 RepID=A0A1H9HVQ7_9HYPH|nr:glutamine amidotransferase [Faunimonas pinastri]SEQ66390.1 GMP synthase (glutamine-hydrolysing) [Faunimonas pinastri]